MQPEQAQTYVIDAIESLYCRLQQGLDVAPGQRFRLEGQVELLLLQGVIERNWLEQQLARLYQDYFDQPLEDAYWQWMALDQRFYLPVKMQDAPVYKK